MRANYDIPADRRCQYCKGWGHFENRAPHGLPHHPQDGYRECEVCDGEGWIDVPDAWGGEAQDPCPNCNTRDVD